MTAALALKANITYVDNQLTFKANQTTTYTKTEVNDLLTPKATITHVDGQLDLKANQLTTYTTAQVDKSLGLKANQLTTYTKTEVDTELAKKACSYIPVYLDRAVQCPLSGLSSYRIIQ
ncbi:MAG: hypothetical protein ACKPKO_54765, partial [Candidatus Fonsibacter sp.]